MTDVKFKTALIVGAGAGLSASLARALSKDGVILPSDLPPEIDAELEAPGAAALSSATAGIVDDRPTLTERAWTRGPSGSARTGFPLQRTAPSVRHLRDLTGARVR